MKGFGLVVRAHVWTGICKLEGKRSGASITTSFANHAFVSLSLRGTIRTRQVRCPSGGPFFLGVNSFSNRGNWWLHSNVARDDIMPVRHEPGFKEALSTMQRLKRAEDKKKQEATTQPSSSSSSWHWQSSWWESDYEHSPQKWYDH